MRPQGLGRFAFRDGGRRAFLARAHLFAGRGGNPTMRRKTLPLVLSMPFHASRGLSRSSLAQI
eukprot:10266355-Ditylum_brightwellii.AAC.2